MTSTGFAPDMRTVEPDRVAWEDGAFVARRDSRRMDDGTVAPVLLVTTSQPHPCSEALDRLVHEHAFADLLDCPAALRPLALLREEGRTVLVLEDWDGEPLDRLAVPLDPVTFLRFAVNIAAALSQLHARGIVHRDISSRHILANARHASVRFTGFGIASLVQQERQTPEPPEFIAGTLAYMAPEQTGRMNRSVDLRSDLYSLGVVFYRLLTGRLPFVTTDPMELVHCHIARQPQAPVELTPKLPRCMSAIVMKLLSKTAEERYQTAGGVAHDLRQCLARWDVNGHLSDFPLGQHDIPDRLLVPEKLYGRDIELDSLIDAFDRIAGGGDAELVLVSGYSGIGKSAVVNELHKALVPRSGLFLAGKFDQIKRDIPYSTLAQAFQSGIRVLLTKTGDELQHWRDALLDALGPNGALMADLVPELTMIIGDQPPVPALSPHDAKRRFHMVFRRFIGVFARAEHPLALFLDDLHWLDAATLDCLEDLLVHGGMRHLLVIGAYRDNEVSADHPLMLKLNDLRASGACVREILLAPLAIGHVERLVTDALHCSTSKALPLASMLHQRTGGNPFFMRQFLSSLADEALIGFDHASGQWTWDLRRIQAKGYTDNVVELMIARLNRLPVQSQRVLKYFACVGNAAELATLDVICASPRDVLREAIAQALQMGLILRTGHGFRFLHDRVQEAAYALIDEAGRPAAHLRIARLLVAHTRPAQREEAIFEIVSQFNRALHLIDDRAEREEVASLNLVAARRAKASTAYESALAYLSIGRSLLGDADWNDNYELMFAIEYLLAECELLCARMQAAETRLDELDRRAENGHDVAQVTRLRITLYTALDRSERSVELCLRYLRRDGTAWTPHPGRQAVRTEFGRIGRLLRGRPIEALTTLPLLQNAAVQDMLDVLTEAVTPAFFTDSNLCALMLCRMVNLSIEHGNGDASCYAYVWLATYAGPFFGQYDSGYRFGCVGYGLVDQHGLTRFKARTWTSFGNIVVPWARHVREGREPIQRAFDIAQETGDFTYTLYTCCDLVQNMVSAGDSLGTVLAEADKAMALSRRSGFGLVNDMLATYRGLVRSLCGLTPDFGSLNDDDFDEAAFEHHLSESHALALPEFDYWVRKMQARYFAGRFDDALDARARAEPLLWVGTSQFETAEYHFYGALSHAACWNDASPQARVAHLDAIASHRRQLETWAQHCPANFENRAALAGAEMARIHGDIADAQRLYDLAVRSARRNGFVHNEAVACEAAARFHAERGLTDIADMYAANARHAFEQWGAKAKVRQIDERHPHLLHARQDRLAANSIDTPVEQLDLATVIRVSQSVSSELLLDNLVHTVMRSAISHAGAERGLLIGEANGAPIIEAEATTAEGVIAVSLDRASPARDRVPDSIVQYVLRTRANVIIDDASMQHDFSGDPYFRQHRARSVACMPLVHQGKSIALLYLENNLVSHVFTAGRVAVLKLLASQAASSLEIARLYRDLHEREVTARENERRFHDIEKELTHANRVATLGQLTASISHEIRQPVASAVFNAQAAIHWLEASPPNVEEVQAALVRVINNGTRATDVIRRIRDLVKKTPARRERVLMNDAIREVIALALNEASKRHVSVVVNLEPDLPPVEGDRVQLQQVMMNLMINAVEAMDLCGNRPRELTLATSSCDANRVRVTVSDTGPGIGAADAIRLFEPFFTTKDSGMGMGLSICRTIVEAHGGTLVQYPNAPHGAVFQFDLASGAGKSR